METDKMDELDDDPNDGAGRCLYVTNTFHVSATLFDLFEPMQYAFSGLRGFSAFIH